MSQEHTKGLGKYELPDNPELPEEAYKVSFEPNDPMHPFNWSFPKKVYSSAIVIYINFVVIFGSSVMSPGITKLSKHFHMGSVVSTLACVSLFVLGFAVGPVVWGPISEIYGRKRPMMISLFIFICLSFAVATADDFQTVAICRFLMGCTGACNITLVPAIMGDMYHPDSRGVPLSITIGVFMLGPMLGPVIGGYIAASYLGWRWTMYLTGIISAFALAVLTLWLPETYAPTCLQHKAKKLRKETGIWPLYAPLDKEELDYGSIVKKVLFKPFYLLLVEPILFLISLYMGFVYGIMYLCLSAIPYVFSHHYHWKGGNIYLPYLGMVLGNFIVTGLNVFVFNPFYVRGSKARGGHGWPEGRLPAMMLTSVTFPVGIFLFTWSGNYHVHWIVPTIGLTFVGIGITGLFLSGMNYVVEAFLPVSASASAANTTLRSTMGCVFPLFALIMFRNLGTQWAGTLIGCIAVVLGPVPIIFYFFGKEIRARSRHTTKDQPITFDAMDEADEELFEDATPEASTK